MGGVAWTEEEDLLLKKCIQQYGEGKWHRVPLLAGLNRCRKSCRLRWLNYLRPNIKRGSFTEEEVEMIIKLHRLLGNRWSLIAGRLPGRTANDVKNYWNCHLSKKLNAQEGEERQMSRNNAQVIKPHQIRNIAAASTSGIKPQSGSPDENEYSPAAPLKRGTAMPSPTVFNGDADHQGHMLPMQTQEDSTVNFSCLDQQGIGSVVGDQLPTDLHFEQVESTKDFKDGYNKWDWDDLLVDMDLYDDSL